MTSPDLRLVLAHRRLASADAAAYDTARALASSAPEDICANFRVAAVARDYATDCRARVAQLKGTAL